MSKQMSTDEHYFLLGKLLGHLQSLESMIRLFLVKTNYESFTGLAPQDLPNAVIGTEYEASNLTSYDSMRTLVNAFNTEADRLGLDRIDVKVIDLRDLLAHGRLLNAERRAPLRIVKFSKCLPNGRHRLVANELMTREWFDASLDLLKQSIDRVAAAFKATD